MPSVKERLAQLRERLPWLDHTLRMLSHYGAVNGNGQAGAVTYFGFLSFFPVLALAFFVVGLVVHVYPDARVQTVQAINQVLPGVVGSGSGQISLTTIEDYSGTVGIIGVVSVLYAGLGWLSGLRQALEVMFSVPRQEQPNFVVGKLRDLVTLALIGLTLLVSVALSGAVTGFTGALLDLVGIDPDATLPSIVLTVLAHALAISASTLLLMLMFTLLISEPHVPRGALVRGALLGAVGFELLKLAANLLLGQTKGQPAFQAFGVALILLVWINYFSRLVMYAAAWSYTSPSAVAVRTQEATVAPGAALPRERQPAVGAGQQPTAPRPWGLAAAAAAGAALTALVVRGSRR